MLVKQKEGLKIMLLEDAGIKKQDVVTVNEKMKLIDFVKAIAESKINVDNIKDINILDACNEVYTDNVSVVIKKDKTIDLILPFTTRGEHEWID
jgi:hypothetical protein